MYLPKHLSEFIEKQMSEHETKIQCLERLLGHTKPAVEIKPKDWRRMKLGEMVTLKVGRQEMYDFVSAKRKHEHRHNKMFSVPTQHDELNDIYTILVTRTR